MEKGAEMASKIWCFVLLFLLLFGTFFTASAFRFKSSGSTITVPDDFPTIQAAAGNASDGDTIFIRAGLYNESVTLDKALTLLGEDRSNTTIWTDASKNEVSVWVQANGTIIKNLTLEYLHLGSVSNALVQDCNLPKVEGMLSDNSTFSRNNLLDFRLYNCSQFSIEDNVFDFAGGYPYLQAYLWYVWNSTFSRNTVLNGSHPEGCFFMQYCTNNTFLENKFVNNIVCLWFVQADNNTCYHNNFMSNLHSFVFRIFSSGNVFDAGYPAGGNYYSDYSGKDLFRGVYQNETGSDGIGDTPLVWYDWRNGTTVFLAADNYPLMKPYSGPHDIGVLVKASKTTIAQGYNASVVFNVTVINYGLQSEDSNFTFNMLGTDYETALSLESRNSTVYQYTLDTTGFKLGNYTVWAYVSPVSDETDTFDNNSTLTIRVVIPGDVSSTTPGVPDGTVNMKDIAYMISLFNTRPNSVNWDPNVDVNNDGVCNMRDIAIAVAYFNQHE